MEDVSDAARAPCPLTYTSRSGNDGHAASEGAGAVNYAVNSSHRHWKEDFDTGQRVRHVLREHDLFGDETVTCLPTYGQTPGAIGRYACACRTASSCSAATLAIWKRSLAELHLPGVCADREATLAVLTRFREMQARGARIMFGHDSEFWTMVPQGPQRLG